MAWAWMLVVAGCGGGNDEGGLLDPYTLPSVADCRLDQTQTVVRTGETYQWDTWGYDGEERGILRDTSINGTEVYHLAAEFDDDDCRTLYVDQVLESGVVIAGDEVAVTCEEHGARSHGEGTRLYAGEAFGLTVDTSTTFDQGLPVAETLVYTPESGDVTSERYVWDWLDGGIVGQERYEDQHLELYERWTLDDAGRVTGYEYGDADSDWFVAYEYDEHDRVVRQTTSRDADGVDVYDAFTFEWSDTQATLTHKTYDHGGDGVDDDIVVECTEGWPWSCREDWHVAGVAEVSVVVQQDWSCAEDA